MRQERCKRRIEFVWMRCAGFLRIILMHHAAFGASNQLMALVPNFRKIWFKLVELESIAACNIAVYGKDSNYRSRDQASKINISSAAAAWHACLID